MDKVAESRPRRPAGREQAPEKLAKSPGGRLLGDNPGKLAKADVLDSEAHVDKVAKAVPEGRHLNKLANAPQHHRGRNAHRAQKGKLLRYKHKLLQPR